MFNNCISDRGYKRGEQIRADAIKQAAIIRQVAAVAIAIDNGVQLVENYKKQRDISDRMLKIMERQQNQLSTVFWPREEQFLNEFANPEPIESVDDMARRYGGRLVPAVAAAFATQLREAKCSMRRYCTSANRKMVQDLLMARSVAVANAKVLGRNIAFAEYQARHDTNYERRMQAVAIGRGLMQQAATLYASAGQSLAAAGNYLSSQFNNALTAFGYARGQYQQANTTLDYWQNYQPRDIAVMRMPAPNGQVRDPFAPNVGDFSLDATYSSQGLGTGGASNIGQHWTGDSFYTQYPLLGEKWNEGDIGNRDLVRNGIYTFPVAGVTGGTVTVDMSKFQLAYADHKTQGEYNIDGVG